MLLSKLISLPLALTLAVSAPGEIDIDYSGEIDISTGQAVDIEDSDAARTVTVSEGVSYDTGSRMFRFSIPENGDHVYASVSDKMITAQPVSLKIDPGVTVQVYNDGEAMDDLDISYITQPGNYSVTQLTNGEIENQIFSFMIVPKVTGAVSSYKLPAGFTLKEIAFNGETKPLSGTDTVDMTKDGDYTVTYSCKATGIDYGLKLTVDHTPPSVTVKGLKDGKARSAVTVSGFERSDDVAVKHNGEELDLPEDGVLKMPGRYEVTVTDVAGNSVTETFTIRMYLNAQGVWFALLLFAVIAAAAVYMYLSRKK